jgi:hypothetical protein
LYLKVEKTRGENSVQVGIEFQLGEGITVMGRDPSADIVLADNRVSRKHASLYSKDGDLWAENHSNHGTYINGKVLEGVKRMRAGDRIQVGNVLLRFEHANMETLPTEGPIPIPGTSPRVLTSRAPALWINTVEARVRFYGHSVALQPMPFRLLTEFARNPGRWIRLEALRAAVWQEFVAADVGNLKKYVSYARGGIRAVLDAEPTLADQVRAAIRNSADAYTRIDHLDEADNAALLQEFIKARRKLGYRLHLSEDEVVVEDFVVD